MNFPYVKNLFESASYDSVEGNEDIMDKLGEVNIYDVDRKETVQVKVGELMKTCSEAAYKMQRDYPYLYQFMAKCKMMYIPVYPSEVCDTMCVDSNGNLWINFFYVYNVCKMDSNRVFGILFHEMFHVFFDHLARFRDMYPKENFGPGMEGAYKKANMKANICMDYEVNASMVEDNIVDSGFWTRMNCLYKKEYTGMTWEEIMDKAGDVEYRDWLARNGFSLEDKELKLLEAIEKASKVLMDKDATDEEKRAARKELRKKIEEIFGKESKSDKEKSIQDILEDLAETKLGDVDDMVDDLERLADDLNKSPSKMTDEELDKTLKDIDKLADDMIDHSEDIGNQFGKTDMDVAKDAEVAREALKDAMKKMKEGSLTREEKEDLIDKAKDALEDVISDEVEKEKLKEKRAERDAAKAEERRMRLKKSHPINAIIVILKNFAGLKEYKLVSDKTVEICERGMAALDPLTEKHFKDMTEDDFKEVREIFNELKESFLPDMVALIDNETILNKTEEDMQRVLDGVFEYVFKAFDTALDKSLDDESKGSVIKTAAQKMRIIGKILKTQKVWRVGPEFKEAYIKEMKRLMDILKTDGKEALLKELMSKGAINPMYLDKESLELYNKITGGKPLFTEEDMEREDGRKSKLGSYTDEMAEFDGTDEEVKPYEGKMYYKVYNLSEDEDEPETMVALSDDPDYLKDDDFEQFGLKFEKDFPEYWVHRVSESVFEVVYAGEDKFVKEDELVKKLEGHSDYEKGNWEGGEAVEGGKAGEGEEDAPKYTSYYEDDDEIKPFEGKMFFNLYIGEADDGETILELSDISEGMRDSGYEKFGMKFEKDFPEYRVEEIAESQFEVCYAGTFDYADIDDLRDKLEENPDYEYGEW